MRVDHIDTPALVVDLDMLERNLAVMANAVATAGLKLRPHAKSHKCIEIAERQIALGAAGICCQKASEAEAMVAGGIADVFISNEVYGRQKAERIAALAEKARIAVCVDAAEQIRQLETAAAAAGVEIGVAVELDVGDGRAGISPGDAAVALAQHIARMPHLRFYGLQAYKSTAQHMADTATRRRLTAETAMSIRQTLDGLERAGIACPVVSGGGTGTFDIEEKLSAVNELQGGTYVFMDANYNDIGSVNEAPFLPFEQSLHVVSTVMSANFGDRAVIDAGVKAVCTAAGYPTVADRPELRFVRADDEHGHVEVPEGSSVGLGDRLRLVPSNCDPTVNLYDWLVVLRDGVVVALWPVAARGRVL